MNSKELFKSICADIEADRPTDREVSRKALKKFMGKEMIYTATYEEQNGQNGNILVMDVKIKGKEKVLCHHLWLKYKHRFNHGDVLEFKGSATSYNDKNGERKYRLEVIGKVKDI